jgi:predicted aspartyl protease
MAHIGAVRNEYDQERGLERLRRDCPKAWIQIHGTRLEALLDSGAELNTIRWKTALAAGLSVTSLPREMENAQLRTANGGRESFEGIV